MMQPSIHRPARASGVKPEALDAVAARRPRARGRSRVTAVVCGHIGSNRSAIGLELARVIHRPCIDLSHGAFAPEPHVPTAMDDALARADIDRFESIVRPDFGNVIVAPCTLLSELPDSPSRPHLWVAWIDVAADRLTEQARQQLPDLDVERFRHHLRAHESFIGSCDATIDTTDRSAGDVADFLGARFRHEVRMRNDLDDREADEHVDVGSRRR